MLSTGDTTMRISEELQHHTTQIVSQLRAREEEISLRETEQKAREAKFESEESQRRQALMERETAVSRATQKLDADTQSLELRIKKLLAAEQDYEERCKDLEAVQRQLEGQAAALDTREAEVRRLREQVQSDHQSRLAEAEAIKAKLLADRETFETESRRQFEEMKEYLQKQRATARQILNDASEQIRDRLDKLTARENALAASEERLAERQRQCEEERQAAQDDFAATKKELNEKFRQTIQERVAAYEADWARESYAAREELEGLKNEARKALADAQLKAVDILHKAEESAKKALQDAEAQRSRILETAEEDIQRKLLAAQQEIEHIKREVSAEIQEKITATTERENETMAGKLQLDKEREELREKHVRAIQEAKQIVSDANAQAAALLTEIQRRSDTILEDARSQASMQMSQIAMERKKLDRERDDFHTEMELRRANIEQEMLASFEEKYKNMDSHWKQREAALIQQEVKNAKLEAAEILKIANEQAETIRQNVTRQVAEAFETQNREKIQALREQERRLETLARQLREKQEMLQQREVTLAGVRAEMEALAYELVDDTRQVST